MYKRYGQSSFSMNGEFLKRGERLTNGFLKSMKEANLTDLEWKKRIN